MSVNQVIRFLTRKNASRNQRAVGLILKGNYETVRSKVRAERPFRDSARTDAVDINEYIRYWNLNTRNKNILNVGW